MSQSVNAHWTVRGLSWLSWLSLGGAVLLAVTALFCHWGVNADSLGARDMGLALFLAAVAAVALVGSVYAVPVLVALGIVGLFLQRSAGVRFLVAAAGTAVPIAVLTWLEQP